MTVLSGDVNASSPNVDIYMPLALQTVITDAITKSDTSEYDKDQNYTNGSGQKAIVYRLREGIERFFITDINNPAASSRAQSGLPIMWDQISKNVTIGGFNHIPGGSNVLYMDGHVEFIKYPGDHPITKAMIEIIDMATKKY